MSQPEQPADKPETNPLTSLLLSANPTPPPNPTPTSLTSSETEAPAPQGSLQPTGQTDLSIPVDTLFQVDPLNLTKEDLISLVRYYRAQRLNFQALEARPKQVRSSRTAMSPEASAKHLDAILEGMIGGNGNSTKEQP